MAIIIRSEMIICSEFMKCRREMMAQRSRCWKVDAESFQFNQDGIKNSDCRWGWELFRVILYDYLRHFHNVSIVLNLAYQKVKDITDKNITDNFNWRL